MYTDSTIILFLASSAIVLALILLVIAGFYIRVLEKLKHAEHANVNLRSELAQKPLPLLTEAHEKALQIIEAANKKAEEIIESTKNFESESKKTLEGKLDSLEEQEQNELKKAAD